MQGQILMEEVAVRRRRDTTEVRQEEGSISNDVSSDEGKDWWYTGNEDVKLMVGRLCRLCPVHGKEFTVDEWEMALCPATWHGSSLVA